MAMTSLAITATLALTAFVVHIVSITWFLRGIRARNELIVQSVEHLSNEFRNEISRLRVSIDSLSIKLDSVMGKVHNLITGLAVTEARISSIENEGKHEGENRTT